MIDLTGRTIGRWEVIRLDSGDKYSDMKWLCQCSCGTQARPVRHASLMIESSRSCGCLHNELLRSRKLTHGRTQTPEHNTWKSMIHRCHSPNDKEYKRYGAKGITVCDEWKNSIEQFILDMGPRPIGTSIDRINNSKGYYPENCRWATYKEQARNNSGNHPVEHNGKLYSTIAELAEFLSVGRSVVLRSIRTGQPLCQ